MFWRSECVCGVEHFTVSESIALLIQLLLRYSLSSCPGDALRYLPVTVVPCNDVATAAQPLVQAGCTAEIRG